MEVVIIGTGNVATVLSKLIIKNGHTILEVLGREYTKALAIADTVGAKAINVSSDINTDADIYIIAVSDDAIADITSGLLLQNKLVIHTAGSISGDILKNMSNNYGVLWPLQTLRKEMQRIPKIPFVIDANNDAAFTLLEQFAKSLSTQCIRANDAERVKLHLAAVAVSNFTNHLFALAENYCKNEGLGFKLLFPLIDETVKRIEHRSAKDVQTGPAIRGDVETIQKHLHLLKKYPDFKKVYQLLTAGISHKQKFPMRNQRE